MTLEQLIGTYGYWAIAIGTFLEGETVLVLGGLAAHRGYLALPWVLVSAFGGTVLGDQLYFYIGRWRGERFLEQKPHFRQKSEKVLQLLHRHRLLLILGFRFLYGLRTITPFLLGASGVPPLLFLLLNILGACLWALVVGVSGYLFGHALELFIGDIKRYEIWMFVGLALSALIAWAYRFLSRR